MNRNYQRELEEIINSADFKQKKPRLLMHGCCAPCSSYCLTYLSEFFDITLFYYNPNISPFEEYSKRRNEAKRLAEIIESKSEIAFAEGKYDPERFFEISKGLESCPEGGERCKKCFELRLSEAVDFAEKNGFDYVTTTLTVSPLKNAAILNAEGEKAAEGKRVLWLPCDFKKKNGFLKSIQLSSKYGLYRQNYCGCIFSKR